MPAIATIVSPDGTVSVTVTVPLVAPLPAAFDTVTVYVAFACPCVKFPVCAFVIESAAPAAAPVNVAVTVVFAVSVTTHVPVPVQPPPLHPANVEPEIGRAHV